ncbi:MAG: formylglycine-generating enzyme family protein [Planctomycetota bacterium]
MHYSKSLTSLIGTLAVLLACQWSMAQEQKLSETLGIAKVKPESGQFVELPNGLYMVPYTAKIPGTDVEFTMTPIPGGTFTMGSSPDDPNRRDDEGPQFDVIVEPFWMGKYEVTWAEYKKYMKLDEVFKALHGKGLRKVSTSNQIDAITAPSSLYDPSFTYWAGEGPDQPAATMTQYAAKQYTKWLSLTSEMFYRLPTEAEWEYACRAGTKTTYYWGDDSEKLDEHAWHFDNAEDERHTHGELKPNAWGLYDMYGNVCEWVLDEYSEEGYDHVEAGSTVTVEEAFRKPTKLYPRVVRGGSFELEPEDCRSAARVGSDDKEWKTEDPNFPKSPWWYTDLPGTSVGFRLLRPLDPPKTRPEREEFWKADLEQIVDDAKNRIDANGRGAYGTVDPSLPSDIKAIDK